MPSKGSSANKHCCCGGCAEKLHDDSLNARVIQPLRQFCCACAPKQICVEYEIANSSGTVGYSGLVELVNPCDPPASLAVITADNHTSWRQGANWRNYETSIYSGNLSSPLSMHLHFSGLSALNGATINSASIELTSKELRAGTADVDIYCAVGQYDNPTTQANYDSWLADTRNDDTPVFWSQPSTNNNVEYTTPDLTPAVQAAVDGAGFSDELLFYFYPNTGDGFRHWDSSLSTGDEPELNINYTPAQQSLYRGNIGIGSELISVDFRFVVEDETCYLSLVSSDLGETGDNRIELNSANRAILCPGCQNCPNEEASPDTLTFDLTGTGTGTGVVAQIHVRPAGNKSFHKLPDCCDCPDPCYPSSTTEDGCAPRCADCQCICQQACILLIVNNEVQANETADLCNWQYASSSVTISIPDEDCCVLRLDSVSGYTLPGDLSDVTIGDAVNPCPRPTGHWFFLDGSDEIEVVFSCSGCGGCDTAECPCPAPKVLTASFSAEPRTGTGSGTGGCCSDVEIPLIYADGVWDGNNDTGWCGGGLDLEIECNLDGTFTGELQLNNCEDTSGNVVMPITADSVQCDPFRLEFEVVLDDTFAGAGGPFCCIGNAGGAILTLVVTE